jgi:hypothetical protein
MGSPFVGAKSGGNIADWKVGGSLLYGLLDHP